MISTTLLAVLSSPPTRNLQIWPQYTSLDAKLWGSTDLQQQTAEFTALTGLQIWRNQSNAEEEEESTVRDKTRQRLAGNLCLESMPQLSPFKDDCRLLYTRSVYRLCCTKRKQIAERNKKKMLCRSMHQSVHMVDIQNHRVLKFRGGGLGVNLLCQWSCNGFFSLVFIVISEVNNAHPHPPSAPSHLHSTSSLCVHSHA
jgi:hypothetical protein